MAKLVTSDLTTLINETAAVATINGNFALVETAIENTLSRDGTSPNEMEANLDMNDNRILNLPEPVADTEPLRVIDAQPFVDAAEAAQAAAEAALDQFTDLYLGQKGSDPLLDNDNNALQYGAMYFNTNEDEMRVYGPNLWVPVASFSAYDEVALLVEAAEDARDAAQLAETNAETAETNAETAETNAETAEANAETAQAAAEAARDLALSYRNAAQTAQTAAELAETHAETAETNAETAETNAELAEANAEAAAIDAAAQAAKLRGTSTTSLAIGTGSKGFTTQAGKQFDVGNWLLAVSDADEANYMHGQVTAYSGTSLTVNVTNIGGAGTFADWSIYVSGTRGAIGPAGSVDFTVLVDTAVVAADSTLFGDASDSDNPKKRTFTNLITDLGLATTSGVAASYQPLDADLTAIAGLSPSNDDIIQRKAGAWVNRTMAQLATDLDSSFLTPAEGNAAYQPLDSDLTAIAALTTTTAGRAILTYADPNADRIIFWDDSGTALTNLTATNGLEISNTDLQLTTNQRTIALHMVIDGGGSTITTGIKGDMMIPFACTITEWTLLADQSGAIVVDIWKDTYANYPPVVGDSITASAKPTISASGVKNQSSTLTGWTSAGAITAGDTLRFNVDSVTSHQRVTLILKCTKT